MQQQTYPITKWAKDDQPREKLLSKNPESLSDSELIAILIRTGTPDCSAVDVAKRLLHLADNSLHQLGKLTVRQLMDVKGIGYTKAVSIAAALELGRRRQATITIDRPLIGGSQQVAAYFQSRLKDHHHEVFAVIYLNSAGKVRHFATLSQGGITGTIVDPRLILKKALEEDAVSIILCHNHPSGSLKPSKADKDLTARIRDAASLFDIKLLDHVIVSEEGHFSFADEGLISG